MKSFDEMNYYEILEVPVTASPSEIRQAYEDALSMYKEDSLSTYSLFTDNERERVLRRMEDAFATLIDEKKREDYRRTLAGQEGIVSQAGQKQEGSITPPFPARSEQREDFLKGIWVRVRETDVGPFADEILSSGGISGSDLRRLRERAGLQLEEVFEVTRVNVSILNSIENDEPVRVPAVTYLKGFLRSYAELLQVANPKRVVDGYLKHLERLPKAEQGTAAGI